MKTNYADMISRVSSIEILINVDLRHMPFHCQTNISLYTGCTKTTETHTRAIKTGFKFFPFHFRQKEILDSSQNIPN